MSRYIQSGIECHSLAEVYFVGWSSEDLEVFSLERYDRAPLRYQAGGEWREWMPAFIMRDTLDVEDKEFLVEVTTKEADGANGDGSANGAPDFDALAKAHPEVNVRVIDGDRYKRPYRGLRLSSRISGYVEAN